MTVNSEFVQQIHQAWGNPKRVANLAFGELFRKEYGKGLGYDDQIRYAMQAGVLAGSLAGRSPEEFIAAFSEEFLN